MEEEEQRPTAPQTCCSGSATTAFMISGTYCFTSSLHTAWLTFSKSVSSHLSFSAKMQHLLAWFSLNPVRAHMQSSRQKSFKK